MIRSMTAYARREIKGEWGSATWEMRSVNQRYLETYFRLPEQFRSLEPVVRERIRSRLTRGKVECTLRYEPDVSAQGELILNEKLAKQLVTAANWVKMQSDEGEINPVDILRWPGVMAAQEQDRSLCKQGQTADRTQCRNPPTLQRKNGLTVPDRARY